MENNPISVKEELYQACLGNISQRIATIEETLETIEEAMEGEAKSSAGDKFETGRALLQMETEKNQALLREARRVKDVLQRIGLHKNVPAVEPGSLVKTNKGAYFIAIGVGKVQLADQIYFCISAEAPIAQKLLGRKVGDTVEFNNNRFHIEQIL